MRKMQKNSQIFFTLMRKKTHFCIFRSKPKRQINAKLAKRKWKKSEKKNFKQSENAK